MSPRIYGVEYPERPLMAVISDLLGIDHFPTSNGSTVPKAFLAAAAGALGVHDPNATKDELLAILWEHTNATTMPDGHYSNGGTVKNDVLQEIVDGIITHRLAGITDNEVEAAERDLDTYPDLDDPEDNRRRALREVAVREGQDAFRTAVLKAYSQTCVITGADNAPGALEASHIVPYRGRQYNVTANGLCLRRDIHARFDRGQLGFHEETHELILGPSLRASAHYREYEGFILSPPRRPVDAPWPEALARHRARFNL